MPVRNGLLSTLRAKGRTALFALLILVLTVALTLGLGMWAYSGGLLAEMEEQYTSVALVEYMGEYYPSEDIADPDARAAWELLDHEAMSAIDGVELWEPVRSTMVSVDGYKRPNGDSPYLNSAVVVATIKPEYDIGRGRVDEADLPLVRAVLHYRQGDSNNPDDLVELPGGMIGIKAYCHFTFHLPGLEPLELPCYSLEEDGRYSPYLSWEEGSEEPPEGSYVLSHAIGDRLGNRRWIYTIVGEIPAEYEQYARDFMDQYDPFNREFMETRLKGADEWPVYWHYAEEYVEYNGEYRLESDVYYSNHEIVISGKSHGRIKYALYSPHGTDSMACFFSLAGSGFVPDEEKTYLLHGAFVAWGGGARNFAVQPFPGSDETPWLELSGDDDPALTDSVFTEYAKLYRITNNTAVLTASDNVAALELFQQGTLYLTDGRFPQAGEAGVCVLSGGMAEYMKAAVGDTISLEVLDSNPYNRDDVSPTGDVRTLEVVGITNPASDYLPYVDLRRGGEERYPPVRVHPGHGGAGQPQGGTGRGGTVRHASHRGAAHPV